MPGLFAGQVRNAIGLKSSSYPELVNDCDWTRGRALFNVTSTAWQANQINYAANLKSRQHMLFLIAMVGWIGGVFISFYNGNRKLPFAILLIGLGLFFAPIGIWRLVGIALLAAIIWIANKVDMA